jgi:hypothetical protein
MSSKAAPFFSIATTSSETLFFSTREVLRMVRKIRLVSRSPGLHQRLLDVVVDRRFPGAHEARAHVDALRPSAMQAAIW